MKRGKHPWKPIDVAVDAVIFTVVDKKLCVLLVRRARPPFEGMWALPGGFLDIQETTRHAAERVLKEHTGVPQVYLDQLASFDDPKRHPEGRVISVAYMALVRQSKVELTTSEKYRNVRWCSLDELPKLALDHAKMIKVAYQRLRDSLARVSVLRSFLPDEFSLFTLQELYEVILRKRLDKGNFRRKILSLDVLVPTLLSELRSRNGHRPALQYRFKHRRSETVDVF